jgi:hypothetical protein
VQRYALEYECNSKDPSVIDSTDQELGKYNIFIDQPLIDNIWSWNLRMSNYLEVWKPWPGVIYCESGSATCWPGSFLIQDGWILSTFIIHEFWNISLQAIVYVWLGLTEPLSNHRSWGRAAGYKSRSTPSSLPCLLRYIKKLFVRCLRVHLQLWSTIS